MTDVADGLSPGPGLCSPMLEDCALCQETVTSSELAAKAREGHFDAEPRSQPFSHNPLWSVFPGVMGKPCVTHTIRAPSPSWMLWDLPDWVPDEACSLCTACKAPFTVIRRKHHCRSCGKIFCSRCSSHSAPLPRYGQMKPVRVCTHCYMFHVTPFYSDRTGGAEDSTAHSCRQLPPHLPTIPHGSLTPPTLPTLPKPLPLYSLSNSAAESLYSQPHYHSEDLAGHCLGVRPCLSKPAVRAGRGHIPIVTLLVVGKYSGFVDYRFCDAGEEEGLDADSAPCTMFFTLRSQQPPDGNETSISSNTPVISKHYCYTLMMLRPPPHNHHPLSNHSGAERRVVNDMKPNKQGHQLPRGKTKPTSQQCTLVLPGSSILPVFISPVSVSVLERLVLLWREEARFGMSPVFLGSAGEADVLKRVPVQKQERCEEWCSEAELCRVEVGVTGQVSLSDGGAASLRERQATVLILSQTVCIWAAACPQFWRVVLMNLPQDTAVCKRCCAAEQQTVSLGIPCMCRWPCDPSHVPHMLIGSFADSDGKERNAVGLSLPLGTCGPLSRLRLSSTEGAQLACVHSTSAERKVTATGTHGVQEAVTEQRSPGASEKHVFPVDWPRDPNLSSLQRGALGLQRCVVVGRGSLPGVKSNTSLIPGVVTTAVRAGEEQREGGTGAVNELNKSSERNGNSERGTGSVISVRKGNSERGTGSVEEQDQCEEWEQRERDRISVRNGNSERGTGSVSGKATVREEQDQCEEWEQRERSRISERGEQDHPQFLPSSTRPPLPASRPSLKNNGLIMGCAAPGGFDPAPVCARPFRESPPCAAGPFPPRQRAAHTRGGGYALARESSLAPLPHTGGRGRAGFWGGSAENRGSECARIHPHRGRN
ncbi:hypothetical protein JZ751_025608 [Albula glossodonta]|uniref:Lateral signaling target protein 2 homolog n=1 Tax=Albula glossodonta TaxID=121402 RepID=A0A8T2NGX0_9TELE|nr:hypothetical protein JZ751_025608 [Albula glossodonta]